MPISEKIISNIEKLEIDGDLKKVMTTILEFEDRGGKQYKKNYELIVDEYITLKEREENGSSNR